MTFINQGELDRENAAVGDDGEEIVEQDPDMLYDAWRDAQLEEAWRRNYMPRECLIDGSDCGHNSCPVAKGAKL
jgi:hypothetical protein